MSVSVARLFEIQQLYCFHLPLILVMELFCLLLLCFFLFFWGGGGNWGGLLLKALLTACFAKLMSNWHVFYIIYCCCHCVKLGIVTCKVTVT